MLPHLGGYYDGLIFQVIFLLKKGCRSAVDAAFLKQGSFFMSPLFEQARERDEARTENGLNLPSESLRIDQLQEIGGSLGICHGSVVPC